MQISKNLGVVLLLTAMGCAPKPTTVKKAPLTSPTKALLQAISIVDEKTAWVSGHKATFLRTVNGGSDWRAFTYELIDSLQFRDIHAFTSDEIVLMSAGPGNLSRIFRFSIQQGFEETYVMPYEQGFLNTIEFWDDERGLAFGDSFNGELFVLKTVDGGRSWTRLDPKSLPSAGEGEGGFAASGACISTRPDGKAWIGTGAGGNSRVLCTSDFGQTWETYEVPMVKGPSAGITSIRMSDDQTGLIVGGDLAITDQYTNNVALTDDGGKTWQLTTHPATKGAFYGSDLVPWDNTFIVIASGPNGIDYSTDLGRTFINLDTGNYWAVDLHPSGFGLATGTDGKILKLLLK
ncbi:WD40/YVTN/BNR-like repeat-containing protein [Marinoscillum sp.]|uniref:WD40/YVTN/BNR-like repeat-containing protein n=1 Tax=Marinoscillum sp. TaxID=2024838 RepID=UPI003BAA28C8